MTSSIGSFNSIFALEKPELKVIEVSDLTIVQKVAKDWLDLATRRFQTAKQFSYDRTPICNPDMLERLGDSNVMIKGIYNRVTAILADKITSPPLAGKTALACLDQDSKFQALALIDNKQNKIIYIVTHPDNIPTRLSKHRVRGAGTQIILHLAKIALHSGNSIRLYCLDGVQGFYDKFGFEQDEQSLDIILTAEKIKDLVSRKIPPFDQLQMEKE